MKLLLVEDNERVTRFVTKGLHEAGHSVDHAGNGRDGLFMAASEPYDVIIMDRMLPGQIDGLGIIEALRRSGNRTPILILSALSDVDERIRGLQAGGDDYLTKPFDFAELLARVQALIRRATGTPEPTRLVFADLSLDLLTRKVQRGSQSIELRPREFALLEYLMRNAGRVVSKTSILSHVWGYNFDPNTNVVDVLVSRLRDRIDKPFPAKLLHTVRGVGYVLRPPS
jgi:two-component system OmpR family response regulator